MGPESDVTEFRMATNDLFPWLQDTQKPEEVDFDFEHENAVHREIPEADFVFEAEQGYGQAFAAEGRA
eukprot:6301964-Prorocentrum_lima.AAC.1